MSSSSSSFHPADDDLIQPIIGSIAKTNSTGSNSNSNSSKNNNNNNNNNSTNGHHVAQKPAVGPAVGASQLPSRDVVTGYIKQKNVAHALDSIITELFTTRPEDPEKHLLEFLLARSNNSSNKSSISTNSSSNAPVAAPRPHSHHHSHQQNQESASTSQAASSNLGTAATMQRQDSSSATIIGGKGSLHEPQQGDGTAPRQPVPPAIGTRNASGLILRRRSASGGGGDFHQSGLSSVPRSGTPNNAFNSSSTSHPGASGKDGIAITSPHTNLQAEELLQWILDVTDSSYNYHVKNEPASSSGGGGESGTAASGGGGGGAHLTTMNSALRVPAGLESHPLASRCRQLATRYHATSNALADAGCIMEDGAVVAQRQHDHEQHHHQHHHQDQDQDQQQQNDNVSLPDPTKYISLDQQQQQQQQQEKNGLALSTSSDKNTLLSATAAPANHLSVGPTSPGSPKSPKAWDRDSSASGSPANIFSQSTLNQLRSAYNLSDDEHGHLLLAVTDAVKIVLEWAGDALLVAENLARVVKALVNGERCTVFVADDRSQSLRTVIDGKQITVKYGQGIVGRCATLKKPLLVNNAYSHPSFNPSVDGEVNYITRNVLSMPMMVEGKLIAVVQVLNKKDADFSPVDVEIFKAFTAVAGIVVRDAMTFPLTMRNLELAEGAKELCNQLMNVNMLSEKQAAQAWATMLRGYLGSDCCTILRVQCNENPEGPGRIHIAPEQLELTFVASDSEIDFGGFQPLPQQAIIASALTNRAPELVNDARHDPRFDKQAARLLQHRATTSSLLVVPVFPFGDGEASCCHFLGGYNNFGPTTSSSSSSSSTACHGNNPHHYHYQYQYQQSRRAQFCCYIVQFENFKETPLEIATASNNDNFSSTSAPGSGQEGSGDLNGSTGSLNGSHRGSSVSSANDIIFSEEAVEHIGRILPFFESLLRSMNLIHAQRHQAALLHETSRAISSLCDDRMEIADAFDLLARTIENMIQRERRPSVLFYTKVDSEGIECMQLLPRNSLAPYRGATSAASGTTSSNSANVNSAITTANATTIISSSGAGAGGGSIIGGILPGVGITSSPTSGLPNTGSSMMNNNNMNNNNIISGGTSNRVGQTFRLRRRTSVANLAFNAFQSEIRVPIGSGIVGTAVSGVVPVYFNVEEANELFSDGEFGPLVGSGDVPNCSVLVVPLAEGRTLLGAMVLLRPRGDIVERIMDVLGYGYGIPSAGSNSSHLHQHHHLPQVPSYVARVVTTTATTTTTTAAASTTTTATLPTNSIDKDGGSHNNSVNLVHHQFPSFAGPVLQSQANVVANGSPGVVGAGGSMNPTPQSQQQQQQQQQQHAGGGGGGDVGVTFVPVSQYGTGNTPGVAANFASSLDRNFNWATVTCDQLVQPARIDFLSVLTSVAKYVLKASSTVSALARQQESLLFSGELERLAMPTTNQSALLSHEQQSQSGKGSGTNLHGTGAKDEGGSATSAGGAVVALAASMNNNNNSNSNTKQDANNSSSSPSSSKVLSSANFSQFSFGGRGAASPLDTPLDPDVFAQLTTTSFPIFDFVDGNKPAIGLVPLTVHMFRSLNCLAELNIDEGALTQAILKSFRRYRDVPYHNVYHAFDVTQSLFHFMTMAKLDHDFTPAERFAVLLSAVFHDIDHNGLNNAYHTKAETPFGVIASLSGQKSVLEFHHCQVAIDVINSLQLLRNTSEDNRRRVTKVFFQCILATDMAVHREIQQQIQSTFLGEDGVTRVYDPDNQDHRDLSAKMLLKMADISNPVKDFSLARRWALSVTEEFYRQGDVERLEGHDVLPMFDRQLNAELSKGQIGFITFMAGPFFTLAAKCFPAYEVLTRNMDINLTRWQNVQKSMSTHQSK